MVGKMSAAMAPRSNSLPAVEKVSYKTATKSASSTQIRKDDFNMNSVVEDEVNMTLAVVLPDGTITEMEVDSSTPMMDLLLQVSSRNKIRPGDHMISIISEETGRTVNYKASQSIGSLGVSRIFVLSKISKKHEKEVTVEKRKQASKFEPTVRVTVNLPRGVKSIQRLNPNTPIMDIFRRICKEKGLDASCYEVQLPNLPNTTIDMSRTLTQYETNELSVVACSVPEFHRSMVNISSAGTSAQLQINSAKMSDPFQKVKKKKGLFSFLRRDKKSGKKEEEKAIPRTQVSSQNSDVIFQPRKPQAQVKPQPHVQATILEENTDIETKRSNVQRAPSRKKYRAPAPPPRPLSQLASVKEEGGKAALYSSTPNLVGPTSTKPLQSLRRQTLHVDHSRNSSDSSGYHEAPLTPPQENGQTAPDSSTLPHSLSSGKARPVSMPVQRSQTLPGSSGACKVKKRAPQPPGLEKTRTHAPSPPILRNYVVESEEETVSLPDSNPDDNFDNGPELGVTVEVKGQPPPIFVPPPPPPETPPPVQLTADSPGSVHRELTNQQSDHVNPVNRSESRCSRTSVNTIDDVQMSFESAIAAGETQLKHTEVVTPKSEELANITKDMNVLTHRIQQSMPSQDDINDAVAHLDMCVGENSDSSDSIVPDGQKFTVAKTDVGPGTDSVRSRVSESDYVKPVEEISYGFENPFRLMTANDDRPAFVRRSSKDSHVSDSTLPDSEHTGDRPQSNSLQSSSVQSDDEDVATETGDSTDKALSQSETDTVTAADLTDGPFAINQLVQRNDKRGMFLEVKGQEINKAIYGDVETRGFKGQKDAVVRSKVKQRSASFLSEEENRRSEVVRPKTIVDLLREPAPVTSAAPKRRSAYAAVKLEVAKVSNKPAMEDQTDKSVESVKTEENAKSPIASAPEPYTRSLPVYSRMNTSTGNTQVNSTSARPLASLLSESMKNGEAQKPRKRVTSETVSKPMFFKASSRPLSLENNKPDVIKLDQPDSVQEKKTSADYKSEASKPSSTISRKESLKERFNKLQDQTARWENQLKQNEDKMKSLTASQQNLAKLEDAKSQPFRSGKSSIAQSVPEGLNNKITLRSAADRVIHKPPPQLDPVETLLKSIRDRGGRTSADAPDRGIYVAEGERKKIDDHVAKREVAPSVLAASLPPINQNSSGEQSTSQKPSHHFKPRYQAERHRNDSRFKKEVNPLDNLLQDIVKQKGKPRTKRQSYTKSGSRDSSSHSSSDELQDMLPRHPPTRSHKQKRPVSDPFPPQPNGGQRVQPKMTELDPREELMIAIRNSKGLNTLRQVNEDEIKWSAQV